MGYIRFKVEGDNTNGPVEGGLEIIIDASRILTIRDNPVSSGIDFVTQLKPADGYAAQIRLTLNNAKKRSTLKKFNDAVIAAQNSSVVTVEPSGGEIFASISYDPLT